ncbi:hypothetical protein EDD80_12416 [Anseongella ginsenosidimutans]|uniref:PD-(D/E)XK nuclease superfamily protein n=1 Tax=Anseongella ginsenosidimutans TaxID=496056 RepID=A0A4V6NZ07_9SPHI|nr:hypothetical protein [Anseongella ginsenosidimutans]QEC53614.1 hypothetical protein FRZ59_15575 [Anseongella ginsenosidimutans]TCS83959.1 hypothetical protein EDD80_12416 [Anseongella ginsenosidimutans]
MDRHLNIFEFFNNNGNEYDENNLSRAFALCIKYDTVLLDHILRQVLDQHLYNSLFNTDNPAYSIEIDLQKRPAELTGFTHIVAIACCARELDTSNISCIAARTTEEPKTDLCITINDVCLVFEFKTTPEDCSAQLKCQAEKVKSFCPDEADIIYKDLNWKKIVISLLNALSLQKQINSENQFTRDFARFLEKKHPDWFPQRLLKNISFPQNDADPNNTYLNSRLDQLKTQIFGEDRTKEIPGKYYRLVIAVDNWGWANEVHVGYCKHGRENYLKIDIYPGDTKAQGRNLFKLDNGAIQWPNDVKGYKLVAEPYMKFSHFNSMLFWFVPTEEDYQTTHTRAFFDNYAGRYQKHQWNEFEKVMDSIDPNWKTKCEYSQKITNSNRTYFDLSLGTLLTVLIPYTKAQELDDREIDSSLVKELKSTITSLRNIVDSK